MPLADFTSPSNAATGAWLGIFAALVVLVYYLVALWRMLSGRDGKTRLSPDPINVRSDPGVATKTELDNVRAEAHGRIKREREEINLQIARVERLAEGRADKMEKKLDENTALTNSMHGMVQQMNQHLNNLGSTITNFMRDQARDRK